MRALDGWLKSAIALWMAGWAALKSAALNVYVNAGVIKDRAFAEARLAELSALVATAEPAVNRIYESVRSRL
jgi:formiminotetrahydrofolate cyclodeaminase